MSPYRLRGFESHSLLFVFSIHLLVVELIYEKIKFKVFILIKMVKFPSKLLSETRAFCSKNKRPLMAGLVIVGGIGVVIFSPTQACVACTSMTTRVKLVENLKRFSPSRNSTRLWCLATYQTSVILETVAPPQVKPVFMTTKTLALAGIPITCLPTV